MISLLLWVFIIPHFAYGEVELDQIRSLLEKRHLDDALTQVDRYLEQHQKQPEALFLKGLILFESNKIDDSINVFKLLTEEYPSKPELYNNLAVAYAVKGDYFKARDALQRAIEIYPGYSKAHENIGDIYMNIARESYETAIKLEPTKKSLQAKLSYINNLPIMQGGQAKDSGDNKTDDSGPSSYASSQTDATDMPSQIEPVPSVSANSVAQVEAKKMAEAVIKEEIQRITEDTQKEKEEPIPPTVSTPIDESLPCPLFGASPEEQQKEEHSIISTLNEWAQAWSSMDIESYLSMYALDFKPNQGLSKNAWEKQRRSRFNKKFIKVEPNDPNIVFVNCTLARVTFNQIYQSDSFSDNTRKLILFKKGDTGWRIIKEGAITR